MRATLDVGTTVVGPQHRHEHVVQFYETDELLVEIAGEYLGTGLAAGDAVIVIATEAHRNALLAALRARGHDIERVTSIGRLQLLDAEATLARFLRDGTPEAALFREVLAPVLEKAAAAGREGHIRAYGEMVDVLWRRGEPGAALLLEEIWNELVAERRFTLLCAYSMASFYNEPAQAQRVRALHHDSEETAALSHEVAQRRKVELALRDSLRELRLRERELRQDAERTERLVRITAAIAEAIHPDQVGEAVVDQVAAAVSAKTGALWMLDNAGEALLLCRSVGYPDLGRRAVERIPIDAPGRMPAADVVRTAAPIWIGSQTELLLQYPHLASIVRPGSEYRIACLPVLSQDRAVGTLAFTFAMDVALDDDLKNFLLLTARYSAQAIERLRLLEEAKAAGQRAELLLWPARSVIAAERIEQLYDAALDAVEAALGTDRAAVLVTDHEGVMRFRAWRGLSDAYREAVDGHSPWSRDTRDPQPIFVRDVRDDASLAVYQPVFAAEGIGALGFVPLVASGKLLGKLMVYFGAPRDVLRTEMDLVRAIANHVAAAIDRDTAVAELRETVRFQEVFAGVLGHDLRNPLNAIMSAAQLMMTRVESEKLLKPLVRVMRSGERMARMIEQLLDFTRVRIGPGIRLTTQRFDLLPVIRHVIDELDDAHPEWSIRLDTTGDTATDGDPDRLSQVFSNLVANAVQHGIAVHGARVTIDGRSPDELRVDVVNMGAIPAVRLPKLFEPLNGGDRRRADSNGLGLGLYISAQLVKAHGGSIDVSSNEKDGTRFTVVLPRQLGDG